MSLVWTTASIDLGDDRHASFAARGTSLDLLLSISLSKEPVVPGLHEALG